MLVNISMYQNGRVMAHVRWIQMMDSHSSVSSDILFVTGGYDHLIKFWRPHDGVCHRTVQHPDSQVNALAITPDKRFIAAAGYQHIRMYEVNSSDPTAIYDYEGVSKNINCMGFNQTGIWMYSGGEDMTARIWDLRSHGLQSNRSFQAQSPINCMSLHPSQCTLVMGDQKGNVTLWDLSNDQHMTLVPEPDIPINSVDIDMGGVYLAAANSNGMVYIWSLSSGSSAVINTQPKNDISAHRRYVLKCTFSPDSSLLATTSADSTIKVWSTADFQLRNTLKRGQEKWVWDCAFAQDSQHLFTASSDDKARLWNVDQASAIRDFSGHQKAVVALAYRE